MRVVVADFLPFVKQMYDSLFKTQPVEAVAISSPYALKHTRTHTSLPSSLLSSKLNLGMELDVTEIAEPLRSVAETVFKENESLLLRPLQDKSTSSLSASEQTSQPSSDKND